MQCLDCMHDQPHLGFRDGRVEPIEDRWERMIAGTPWVASCTVTVDADDVETCSGPEAGDALSYAAFGDHGTREFFTHVRFHKHEDENDDHRPPARRALRALAGGGHRGARGGRARPPRDHVAGRGVAPAGGDRRRPALTAQASTSAGADRPQGCARRPRPPHALRRGDGRASAGHAARRRSRARRPRRAGGAGGDRRARPRAARRGRDRRPRARGHRRARHRARRAGRRRPRRHRGPGRHGRRAARRPGPHPARPGAALRRPQADRGRTRTAGAGAWWPRRARGRRQPGHPPRPRRPPEPRRLRGARRPRRRRRPQPAARRARRRDRQRCRHGADGRPRPAARGP